jgi:hypothetical protein
VTEEEMLTTCCYAVQDKTWVTDPDGIKWEVFAVLADADSYREGKSPAACCVPLATLPSLIESEV